MNYFAHGRGTLDRPYLLLGTLLPDWLRVADRTLRLKRKHALPFVGDGDPALAHLAQGIVRHHDDDDRFHRRLAFQQLVWELTATIRDRLGKDPGHRPYFLAHILVEILLDAVLAQRHPDQLDRYYESLTHIDTGAVGPRLQRMRPNGLPDLHVWITRFCSERFLYDYLDDGKLLYRVNRVLMRIGLPQVPDTFAAVIPQLRARVAAESEYLLDFE